MFDITHIAINAHSSIRLACETADGQPVVVYADPFLVDAAHGVPQAPHDADVICFTHNHYDHFSPKDVKAVAKEDTVYVMPASMKTATEKHDIPAGRITFVLPGETATVAGVEFRAVPAYNLCKPFHELENGWVGYVVGVDPETLVYVCGDTDDTPEAEAVECDILLCPVGGKYTMDPEEAAHLVKTNSALGRLGLVIPTHYGSVTGKSEDGKTFKALVEEYIGDEVPVALPWWG